MGTALTVYLDSGATMVIPNILVNQAEDLIKELRTGVKDKQGFTHVSMNSTTYFLNPDKIIGFIIGG